MEKDKKRKFNKFSLFLLPSLAIFIFALVICIKGAVNDAGQISVRGNYPAKTAELRRRLTEDAEAERLKAVENAQNLREQAAQSKLVRSPLVTPLGDGEDEVTVLIYMNGSNLESYNGFASEDIYEMMEASNNPKLHILIQTLGTREWLDHGIASDHSQRYEIKNNKLVLLDDSLPQLDCTSPDTLTDFLKWGGSLYDSNRYFLVLWDHGGGSVDGFGYDEWQDEDASLTMDELVQSLYNSGMKFDFIGMDACIMSSIEVCYALYDYCDYCVLSEDFESALGWSYKGWLSALAEDTSIDTIKLSKILIDDMIRDIGENDFGCSSTLALIDERYIPAAFDSWMNFAYANEETLLSVNYSREVERSGRARPNSKVSYNLGMYYITDVLALAVSISSPHTKSLVSKLSNCVAYYNCSADNIGLTGISVTLPYGDNDFYASLEKVFAGMGINKQYVQWLGNFQTQAAAENYNNYYNFDDFDEEWSGWDDFDYEDWSDEEEDWWH